MATPITPAEALQAFNDKNSPVREMIIKQINQELANAPDGEMITIIVPGDTPESVVINVLKEYTGWLINITDRWSYQRSKDYYQIDFKPR